ncbi:MAG: hypothetical protein JO317_05045 [Verrucomicrobiae bacterium]|nr:hypothetical protein [Verrucomicrobiae bacterium]
MHFRPLSLGVVLASLAFAALAEDKPDAPKPKAAPKKPAYQPLEIPEDTGQVSVPSKDTPTTGDQDLKPGESGESAGSASPSRGTLIVPTDKKKEGDSNSKLWIFTQPAEQAEADNKLREERIRQKQWEELQQASRLPDWATDPEYRKYYDAGQTRDERSGPMDASGDPGFAPTPAPGPSDSVMFPDLTVGGAGAGAGTQTGPASPPLFKSSDSLTKPATPSPFVPSLPSTGGSLLVDPNAGRSELLDPNSDKKKIEDLTPGLNTPWEPDQSSDRYHKPDQPR